MRMDTGGAEGRGVRGAPRGPSRRRGSGGDDPLPRRVYPDGRAREERRGDAAHGCRKGPEMKRARSDERDMLLSYLEKDIENCLYMYADIWKYGPEAEQVSVWYDTDGPGPGMVAMKYHRNFQLYASRGFDRVEGVLGLIEQEKPLSISGRKEIVLQLEPRLSGLYTAEYGLVFKGVAVDSERSELGLKGCDVEVELASEEDAPAIAHLLYMDDGFRRAYTEDSLAQELADRMRTGMGRSCVIRDGSRIAAHNATYAETDRFVIASGFMVHPDYRDTDYALWVTQESVAALYGEGRDHYFFILDGRIARWHKRTGARPVAEYGKLSRRRPD